jgi:C-terminal processing protease CtpA/Prc
MKRKPLLTAILIHAVLALLGAVLWLQMSKRPVSRRISLLTNQISAPLSHSNRVTNERQAMAALSTPHEELVGIGAILKKDSQTGDLLILGSVPGSPAAEAGLAGHFIIREVNGTGVEGVSLQECVQLLRGASGTRVHLTLFDPELNQERKVELTRRTIQVRDMPEFDR